MAIPTDRLSTWTNYEAAAISSARDTHQHIRDRIERDDSRLNHRGEMRFDTTLQGSYANTTIVHDSSDVDILVRMNNPYHGKITNLGRRNRDRYRNDVTYFQQDYSLLDFQQDVYDELCEIYNSRAVTNGNKAIEIDSSKCVLPLDADVVPCQQYRAYHSYNGDYTDPRNFYRGIWFKSFNGTEIINHPTRHKHNGGDKNDADETNENYKKTIRIFKNARNHLVDLGRIARADAPSYHIECLLYNVPSDKFRTNNHQERYYKIVDYLQNANFRSFSAQHGLENLFGHSEAQWRQREAMRFVDELVWLWDYGR
jgi:hypothetical protein